MRLEQCPLPGGGSLTVYLRDAAQAMPNATTEAAGTAQKIEGMFISQSSLIGWFRFSRSQKQIYKNIPTVTTPGIQKCRNRHHFVFFGVRNSTTIGRWSEALSVKAS